MKALLLVAHGSRRAASNAEVDALTGRLAAQAGSDWGWVGHAFLELAEPAVATAIDAAAMAGAEEIRVLPYFLAAGRHVREDLPAQVRAASRRHSGVKISVLRHLGAAEGLVGLLLGEAEVSGSSGGRSERD